MRERYQTYASDVLNHSALVSASRQEIDIEVAIRAYADAQDLHEVAGILSQSDRVREWRATVPHSRSWDEYVRQAQDYIRLVQADAHDRWRQISSEKRLDRELSP